MRALGEYEELDRALEAVIAGERPAAGTADAALLELAAELRDALPLEVSPDSYRAHLGMLAGGAPSARGTPLRRRIAVLGLAASIAVSGFGSTAFAASSSALPGEPLFGVRRAFERVGMTMHFGRESKAAFAFEIVQRRLSDLRRAAGSRAKREKARAAYEAALAEADRLLGEDAGLNDALLDHVEEQLRKHVVVLEDLLDKVPDEAREGIQRAIDNASKAEERAKSGRGKQESPLPRGRGTSRSGRSAR